MICGILRVSLGTVLFDNHADKISIHAAYAAAGDIVLLLRLKILQIGLHIES